MQKLKIVFEDLSAIDVSLTDAQIDEFHNWLRFANQSDVWIIPGLNREILRGDIARFEAEAD